MKTKKETRGGARTGNNKTGQPRKYSVDIKAVTVRIPDTPGAHAAIKDKEAELKQPYLKTSRS